MPQKRNPDPFELVRAAAGSTIGTLTGALTTVAGVALSYHRDLQETKALVIRGTERALVTLEAFERAFAGLSWNAAAMDAAAERGYTIATDVADALIARGVTARRAHHLVGAAVSAAEAAGRPLGADDLIALARSAGVEGLDAPLDARASVQAKRTSGSTHPDAIRRAILELEAELDARAEVSA
jgi:argininosuccinate lyase